jgi:hypothetical protein
VIIEPPNTKNEFIERKGVDTSECCRASYVTPLCFSGKKPVYLVQFNGFAPKPYCEDCIYIPKELAKLTGVKLTIERIEL